MILQKGNINQIGKFQHFQYEPEKISDELKAMLEKEFKTNLPTLAAKLETLEVQIIMDGYTKEES